MILVWGLPGDSPIAQVHAALEAIGEPTFFLDQRRAPETRAQLRVQPAVSGWLEVDSQTLDLTAVRGAYVRPYDSRRLRAVASAGPESPEWEAALKVEDVLLSFCELSPALVVNRPSAMAANGSKPFQTRMIASLGFRVPETLVTTDPEAAAKFWQRHERVVYKSISGVRSVVTRLTREHEERLRNVSWCPTQFQQWIAGEDVRVHVVGDEVFSCRVKSAADDYRYACGNAAVSVEPVELPLEVAERCVSAARAMQLPVAGLDLRYSSAGDWYCFEVNPSPGFSYFQRQTGQQIDAAIAALLAGGASGFHEHGATGHRAV
jgi:RimK-like ATP-grasp domain